MSNPAICQEAIQWALRQFSFKDFLALFQIVPSLKNVVTRGGFTLNPKNYRQDNTTKRLLSTLFRRQDLAQSVMNVLARTRQDAESQSGGALDSPASYKWLEEHWREKFTDLSDARPLGVAFYRDNSHPVLARLGDLLMQTPTFWKTGKVAPGGKNAATIRAQKECIAALEKLIPQKEQLRSAVVSPVLSQPVLPGLLPETASKDLSQPSLPGLLPLTKATAAAPAEENTASETPSEAGPEAAPVAEASVQAESPVAPNASNSREVEKLREELAQARKRNGELSRENDKLRKESRIARETSEKNLRQKTEELEGIRKEYQDIRDEFDDAIDDLRDEFTQSQGEQMASFYAEALGIHPDQLNSLYETQASTQNLRARVEKTLAKQRDMDKRLGTIQKLRSEERNLDQLLSRVREALEDALVVAPGLADLEKELEQKLEDVRKQLRKGAEDGENVLGGILPRIVGYIKELPIQSADSLARLTEVDAFLASSLGRGLFVPDEAKAIQGVVAERRKFIEKGSQVAQALEAIPEGASEEQAVRMAPIHRVGWHLDQLQNTELFIDGYNVIKLDPIMSVKEKSANGFQGVRTEFIDRCKKKAKLFKKVTLVFDGDLPTDNVAHITDNFTVVYAAKKASEQNADNWIVQKMVDCEAKADGENSAYRWIVTNDNGLLARVAELCDGNVDNSTFTAFLG